MSCAPDLLAISLFTGPVQAVIDPILKFSKKGKVYSATQKLSHSQRQSIPKSENCSVSKTYI